MNKSRFEKIGDEAIEVYPALQKQLERLYVDQVEGVLHVLATAGPDAADGLIAGMVTKWGKDTIDLKQKFALGYYSQGYNLAEILCMKEYNARGKSLLAFGSTTIAGMQTKGDLVDYINKTTISEVSTKAKQISKIIKDNIDKGSAGNYSTMTNTLLQAVASSSKAKQIAHDLTVWSYNQGAHAAYQAMGVTSMEWMATEDELTCPYCAQADGTITHIDAPFFSANQPIPGKDNAASIKAFMNIKHAPLHPYCRCTVVPVLDENFDKEQIDQTAKKKSKFAKVKLSPKAQVKTAEDLPAGNVFPNDTLVLSSDGLVYVVTNDPNDSKVDLYGGGDFDFAYVKPIIQSPKIKKLKSSAVSRLIHTPPPAPKVEIIPDLAIVEPEPTVEITPKLKKGEFVFPTLEDIPNLKVLPTKLNGAMGAKIVEDEFGQKWIFKKSSNLAHLQEEVTADELYNLLGGKAPRSKYYEKDGIAYKLSEFIPNAIELGELQRTDPAMYAKAQKKIQARIALNAFLGNDDAVGMEMGNIMVTFEKGEPVIWNVDNGGSLRYSAQGGIKDAARFNTHVAQLWSYRRTNDTMAPVFGPMSYAEVNDSMTDFMKYRIDIEEWLLKHPDQELKNLLQGRLKSMGEYWDIGSDLIYDDFLDTYADKFVYFYMDMERKGTLGKLPEFLNQRGDSTSPTLEDENGVKWDNLRGRNSVSSDIADYIDAIGKWDHVQTWAQAQYNSSFSTGSMKMKAWVATKRTTELKDYFWHKDIGHGATNEAITEKYLRHLKGNEEKAFDDSMTAWHAFNLHMMRKIEMPYVNKARRTISLVRTEDSTLLKPSNPSYKKHENGTVTYKQTPYASASLMKAVAPLGLDAVITAEMPQHRALCFWFMSQRNTNHGILHYENENEVVMIPDKIEFTRLEQDYTALSMKPAKKQSEEAKRIAQRIAEKKKQKENQMSPELVAIENHSFTIGEGGLTYNKKEIMSYLELHNIELKDISTLGDVPWNIHSILNAAEPKDKEIVLHWLGFDKNGNKKKVTPVIDLSPYVTTYTGQSITKKDIFQGMLESFQNDPDKLKNLSDTILNHMHVEDTGIASKWLGEAASLGKEGLKKVLGVETTTKIPTMPKFIKDSPLNEEQKKIAASNIENIVKEVIGTTDLDNVPLVNIAALVVPGGSNDKVILKDNLASYLFNTKPGTVLADLNSLSKQEIKVLKSWLEEGTEEKPEVVDTTPSLLNPEEIKSIVHHADFIKDQIKFHAEMSLDDDEQPEVFAGKFIKPGKNSVAEAQYNPKIFEKAIITMMDEEGEEETEMNKQEFIALISSGDLNKIQDTISLVDPGSSEAMQVWYNEAIEAAKNNGKPKVVGDLSGTTSTMPVPNSLSVPNKNGSMKNITKEDVLLYMADVNVIKTENDLAPIKHWYEAASPNQKVIIQKWLGVEKLEKAKPGEKKAPAKEPDFIMIKANFGDDIKLTKEKFWKDLKEDGVTEVNTVLDLPKGATDMLMEMTKEEQKVVLSWAGLDPKGHKLPVTEPTVLTKEEKKAATEAKVKAMLDKVGEKIAKKAEKKVVEKKKITLHYHKNAMDLNDKEKKNFDKNFDNVDMFIEQFKIMAEDEGEVMEYMDGLAKVTLVDPDVDDDDQSIEMSKKEFAEWLAVTPSNKVEDMLHSIDPESAALLSDWLEEV